MKTILRTDRRRLRREHKRKVIAMQRLEYKRLFNRQVNSDIAEAKYREALSRESQKTLGFWGKVKLYFTQTIKKFRHA